MEIKYVSGDATQPQGDGNKVIVHICNDIGAWGAGFVLAVSNKWKYPERHYRAKPKHILGEVDYHRVEDDIWVANMIGQHKTYPDATGKPPIRYEAVRACLYQVNNWCKIMNASIHMPRIGCGLAGGEWDRIEAVIQDVVDVSVTVYDF